MKKDTFTCGLDAALFVIGGKWKPLILFHLAHGTRRYGELRRAVGNVSDKVLIQQLKELQADGIIDRVDFGEIPRRSNIPSRLSGEPWEKRWLLFCEWGTDIRATFEAIMARRKARERRHAASAAIGVIADIARTSSNRRD